MREASQRMEDLSNKLALVHKVFNTPDNYTVQTRRKMLTNINSIMVPFCTTIADKLETACTQTSPIPAVKLAFEYQENKKRKAVESDILFRSKEIQLIENYTNLHYPSSDRTPTKLTSPGKILPSRKVKVKSKHKLPSATVKFLRKSPRKHRATEKMDDDHHSDDDSEEIKLPPPLDGFIYSKSEAVNHILKFKELIKERTRAIKMMIDKKLVLGKKAQLYSLSKKLNLLVPQVLTPPIVKT